MPPLTYKDAGVDLKLYAQAMSRLPALMRRTHASQGARVMDLPGGFAGLFRLNEEARRYEDPVLVSGTDGVGTKLKVAIRAGRHNTVGIDLVAMCVNDCLCLGAEPLFFLDYLALGKDDPDLVAALVEGVAAGCLQAGAALLGGETAIMPDLYAAGDFDMAGFCVGAVERQRIVDGSRIGPGDVVLGLASSGLHSNGYSLVRKVVFESAGLGIHDHVPELGRTVAEALLEPTTIYARGVKELMAEFGGPAAVAVDSPPVGVQASACPPLPPREAALHGMVHVTGGGLAENIERILPETVDIRLQRGSWHVPPVFAWLQSLGRIADEEMFRVFNMGIGYAVVIDAAAADRARRCLGEQGIDSQVIGEVTSGQGLVEFVG